METTYMKYKPYGSRVSVDWEDIGEGYNGDYDENDPSDRNLLRFTVYLDGEQVDNASYCTEVETSTRRKELKKMLKYIFNRVEDDVLNGYSVDKVCQELSWINTESVTNP